jgi:hypothetical protein
VHGYLSLTRCHVVPCVSQGGSLTKMIYLVMSQPHVKVYSVADALTWGIDVASGIAHLHSLNPLIVHRSAAFALVW